MGLAAFDAVEFALDRCAQIAEHRAQRGRLAFTTFTEKARQRLFALAHPRVDGGTHGIDETRPRVDERDVMVTRQRTDAFRARDAARLADLIAREGGRAEATARGKEFFV